MGLVGETGDAAEPRLRLQLDPATTNPSEQEWFAAFAGEAFRWMSEAVQPTESVFDVVEPTTVDAAEASADR
jgi:hypothetical protein